MNEVEKMMQNANLTNLYCGDDYIFEAMLDVECTNGDKEKCKTCDKAKTSYPPLTVEKQLELIKWLAKNKADILITYSNASKRFSVSCGYGGCGLSENFEIALAMRINSLWQSLTDAEKAQIKDILK